MNRQLKSMKKLSFAVVLFAGVILCDPLPNLSGYPTCRYYNSYGVEIKKLTPETMPNITGYPVYRYEDIYGNRKRLVPRPFPDIGGNPIYDTQDF